MNIWWRDAKLIIIKIFSCRPDLHLSFVYCGYIKEMVNVHWCSYAVIKLKFKKYAVLKPRSEKLLVNYHTNRLLQHRFRARKSSEKKKKETFLLYDNKPTADNDIDSYLQDAMSTNILAKQIQANVLRRKKEYKCARPTWDLELWVCLLAPQQYLASCCASIRLTVRGFASHTQGTWVSLVFTCLRGLISAILVLCLMPLVPSLYTLESFFAFGQPRVAFGQVRRRWKTRMGNGGLIGNRIGNRIGSRWGSYMSR